MVPVVTEIIKKVRVRISDRNNKDWEKVSEREREKDDTSEREGEKGSEIFKEKIENDFPKWSIFWAL